MVRSMHDDQAREADQRQAKANQLERLLHERPNQLRETLSQLEQRNAQMEAIQEELIRSRAERDAAERERDAACEKLETVEEKAQRAEDRAVAAARQLEGPSRYAREVETARPILSGRLTAEIRQREATGLRLQECYRRLIHSELKGKAYRQVNPKCKCQRCKCFGEAARLVGNSRQEDPCQFFENEQAEVDRVLREVQNRQQLAVTPLAMETGEESMVHLTRALATQGTWEHEALAAGGAYETAQDRATACVDAILPTVPRHGEEAAEESGGDEMSSDDDPDGTECFWKGP